MLTQPAFGVIARLCEKRDRDAVRLFMFLLGHYDLRNFRTLSARVLATESGGRQISIEQSLSRLVRLGLLERGPRVLRRPTYRVRPAFLMTADEVRKQGEWLQRRQRLLSTAPNAD